jgi:hypothetical protein
MAIKKLLSAFFLLNVIFLCPSFAQNYNKVDQIVLKYPKRFDTTEELADRIQKDFSSDRDKARAIFSWMAFNINYDLNAFLNPQRSQGFSYRTEEEKQQKIKQLNDNMLQKAFKTQKAVCEGFTVLYSHLASLTGLKSQIIKGDSKTRLVDIGRKTPHSDHAWNMVLIDGKWRLVDVTWGQGYYDSSKGRMTKEFAPIYFDTPPEYFFTKHFPDSGEYLGDKLDREDFLNGPLIYNKLIEYEAQVLEPKSGVIEVKNGDNITFRFKNISKKDLLFYLNKKNQPVKIVNSKERKGGLEFDIVYDKNIGEYITFFMDNNSIVSFKIKQK